MVCGAIVTLGSAQCSLCRKPDTVCVFVKRPLVAERHVGPSLWDYVPLHGSPSWIFCCKKLFFIRTHCPFTQCYCCWTCKTTLLLQTEQKKKVKIAVTLMWDFRYHNVRVKTVMYISPSCGVFANVKHCVCALGLRLSERAGERVGGRCWRERIAFSIVHWGVAWVCRG